MRFVNKSDGARIEIKDTSGGKTTMVGNGIEFKDKSGARAVMAGDGMILISPNEDSTILLTAKDEVAAVSVEGKSKESLKTSINIGLLGDENKPFVVVDLGNGSGIQPTWTPLKDNEQIKKTMIYKQRTICTKSLDLDGYRPRR